MKDQALTRCCDFCFNEIKTGGIMAPITHKWFCNRDHYFKWLKEMQAERIEKNSQRLSHVKHA